MHVVTNVVLAWMLTCRLHVAVGSLVLSLYTLLCPLIAYLCVARTGIRGRAGAALASGSAETRDAESRRSVARGAVCGAGAERAQRPPIGIANDRNNVE